MKSLFDTKISYYRNVEDNVGTEISLRDFLFNDQHKEQIEYIRSISDEDKQKRLKLQLPVAKVGLPSSALPILISTRISSKP